MANPVYEVLLTESPLAMPKELPKREVGAVADFWGVVRRLENGRELGGIEYEAHRAMAEHQLERTARNAAEKFELAVVIIRHRVGYVGVGEASLFVRVASQHRQEAFEANCWIVDELKRTAPIWKRPKFRVNVGTQANAVLPVTAP
jgi:molybdopterin synthase catalytic subunit